MEVNEGETLMLYEDEGDWVLVGRESGKGIGFVPASYVEVSPVRWSALSRRRLNLRHESFQSAEEGGDIIEEAVSLHALYSKRVDTHPSN